MASTNPSSRPRPGSGTPVYLECGAKRIFACAIDWPGWCRSGRTEAQALEALEASRPRYAIVAAEAGVRFPTSPDEGPEVVERVPGSATTDFGAPGQVLTRDYEPLPEEEGDRVAALVAASWRVFDRVVAGAPAQLRKGPRGGGRDRDAIVAHVLGAEVSYARALGLRLQEPRADDAGAIASEREAVIEALRAAPDAEQQRGKSWPPRYLARRIAWHVLDHAWEIEDRTE